MREAHGDHGSGGSPARGAGIRRPTNKGNHEVKDFQKTGIVDE